MPRRYRHEPAIIADTAASVRVEPPERVSLLIGPYSVNTGRRYWRLARDVGASRGGCAV